MRIELHRILSGGNTFLVVSRDIDGNSSGFINAKLGRNNSPGSGYKLKVRATDDGNKRLSWWWRSTSRATPLVVPATCESPARSSRPRTGLTLTSPGARSVARRRQARPSASTHRQHRSAAVLQSGASWMFPAAPTSSARTGPAPAGATQSHSFPIAVPGISRSRPPSVVSRCGSARVVSGSVVVTHCSITTSAAATSSLLVGPAWVVRMSLRLQLLRPPVSSRSSAVILRPSSTSGSGFARRSPGCRCWTRQSSPRAALAATA